MQIDDAMPSRRLMMKTLAIGLGSTVAGAQAWPQDGKPATNGGDILVTELGARGDGATDDTVAFEKAIAAAVQSGRKVRVPAGRYRISRTLEINRGVRIEGNGVERSILLAHLEPSQPAIHVHAMETDSIIGFGLSGLRLICDLGSEAGDGIRLSTGGKGAAIHQAVLRDLFISNVGTGVALSGIIYRSCFDNITVSGKVLKHGFYCDAGFEDVTYNSFWNLEVTAVASQAYAYWIHSNFSNFVNLTADGCAYFSSPGGAIHNIAVEGIWASNPPADTVLLFNQVQIVDGINLIGIDPRKCPVGFHVIGQASSIRGVRCVAPQPRRVLTLDPGSSGTVDGVHVSAVADRLEDYIPSTTLDRWILQGAEAITRRPLAYAEGDWIPALGGWASAPKIVSATWERIGRRMFVSVSARGGIVGTGAATLSLPSAANGGGGAAISVLRGNGAIAARAKPDMSALTISGPANFGEDIWHLEMTFSVRR